MLFIARGNVNYVERNGEDLFVANNETTRIK
jgi:hypothetical protein